MDSKEKIHIRQKLTAARWADLTAAGRVAVSLGRSDSRGSIGAHAKKINIDVLEKRKIHESDRFSLKRSHFNGIPAKCLWYYTYG